MKKWYFLLFAILIEEPAALAAPPDSATAPASTRYAHPNIFQRVFIGGNYRRTWATPVRMRVFDINKEKGGLTVTRLGGGLQTKSLRLTDKQGNEWSLRTVDKTVEKALEKEGIKSGFIKNITQDMISAAHPYGALTVAPMARALGVVNAAPEVVFVPEHPGLGQYSDLFAGTVCLLELRMPVVHPEDATDATEDLRKRLAAGKDVTIDEKALLQARLLDMLIADWDRHDDQWRWGYDKDRKPRVYYPIPRDHDQAYFRSNGILVPLVRPFTMHHLVGFRMGSKKIKQLNRKEWKFDRLFLKDLTEEDWREGVQQFQSRLTDSVLATAARRLPQEIYALHGDRVYQTLRSRRNTMMKAAMKYYHFLQRKVPLPETH